MTHHQLEQMREAEQHQRSAESKERELAAKREVSADQYSRMVDVQIANRQEDTGEHSRGTAGSWTRSMSAGAPTSGLGLLLVASAAQFSFIFSEDPVTWSAVYRMVSG